MLLSIVHINIGYINQIWQIVKKGSLAQSTNHKEVEPIFTTFFPNDWNGCSMFVLYAYILAYVLRSLRRNQDQFYRRIAGRLLEILPLLICIRILFPPKLLELNSYY